VIGGKLRFTKQLGVAQLGTPGLQRQVLRKLLHHFLQRKLDVAQGDLLGHGDLVQLLGL